MVVVFDISRLDSQTARWLSSMIVTRIFNRNKENFIKHGGTDLIKATFVLEEAHSVLGGRDGSSAPSAFVDLAKEGRKYNLGGIFITQQPGSIPTDIVSQGDNFFVFHLLSRTDLVSLSNANAHYSKDIITQILNEPIRGKSYMWTSHQPFVIPIMVRNFEVFVQPNNNVAVQADSTALSGILAGIREEEKNPFARSVYDKFAVVDGDPSIDKSKKGIETFRRLTEEEMRIPEKAWARCKTAKTASRLPSRTRISASCVPCAPPATRDCPLSYNGCATRDSMRLPQISHIETRLV